MKTIKENGLESTYVSDIIALLESLIEEDSEVTEENGKPDKSFFEKYKGDVFIYTDGGSRGNPGPSGCGCLIRVEDYTIRANHFLGHATNNEAEYSGVMFGVKKMIELGLKDVNAHFFSDSQLTMNQLSGKWRIKEPRLKAYADEIKNLLNEHKIRATFAHIPREKNHEADLLTNAAMDGKHIDEILV